jgi:hypothetical protein
MARPEGGYRLKDGTRVPGVTTISGKLKNTDALMAWAWREGKEGRDYKVTRDRAADAGSLAHRAVEAWVRGEVYVMEGDPAVVAKGQQAFAGFLDFAKQTRLEIIEPEISLVSEVHRVGGTLDALMFDGKYAICDWKASAGVYGDMLVQIRAYGGLWSECFPDRTITGGYHLIRFDKESGGYVHHYWPELDAAWELFLHLRAVYDLEQIVRQRAK